MSQTIPDPYAILGIPRDASELQVQRAYRRLARRYHPDLHPDAQTNEQMGRVNQAWETLSNPGRRAQYDAGSGWPRSGSFGHWSAPARRSAPDSPPPQAGNTAWASAATARTYSHSTARAHDDTGPGWRAVTASAATGLLLFVALFSGILPAPLFGIVLLIAARSVFARFD